MNEIRTAFLASARVCRDLIAHSAVEQRWDEPSALEHFTVRGLAGHLVRATGSVEAYLDRGSPDDAPTSAARYYAAAVDEPDINSPLHVAVRERGEAEAVDGHTALVEKLEGLIARLEARLGTEPDDRQMSVFKGLVLRLDDYLVTRIVEQLVHCDDLAVSIGVDTPAAPANAMEIAFANLVEVARVRHGDLAVLRAFTRRERDSVDALRIF